VIVITALENHWLKTELKRAGCSAFLRKPFAGSALAAAVNVALWL
jgi:FixJ family two-component response regulator